MIDLSNKADCCGCRACEQICPRQCVHMRFDDCGFLYPKIDASVCIDCDLCNRVCPNLNYKTDESATRKVYAMSHRDMNIVMQSSSGVHGMVYIDGESKMVIKSMESFLTIILMLFIGELLLLRSVRIFVVVNMCNVILRQYIIR